MTDWNCCPFSSRLTRLLTGVLALKNVSQFVVIALTVAVPPVGADDDAAGEDDVAAGVDGGAEVPDALGLLPPHAAAVAASPASARAPTRCEKCR
jgi:hypothetical protein